MVRLVIWDAIVPIMTSLQCSSCPVIREIEQFRPSLKWLPIHMMVSVMRLKYDGIRCYCTHWDNQRMGFRWLTCAYFYILNNVSTKLLCIILSLPLICHVPILQNYTKNCVFCIATIPTCALKSSEGCNNSCANLNSSNFPSAAYMREWIGSTLVQIMACRLFGARPLSKLGYCQSDH